MDVYGEYHHTIDAKHRLFIPAKFRSELGDTFYITRKLENALIVYSADGWKKLKENIESKPDSAVASLKAFIFPKTINVAPDPNGRVTLSPFLIGYANIDKSVVVAGFGDHVEIWAEEKWTDKESELESNKQSILDTLRELGL